MPKYPARTRARNSSQELEPGLRARTRRRTRQFLAFPPFSPPASHITIKRRVFVAIMEVKLELGSGLGLLVRVLWLGG